MVLTAALLSASMASAQSGASGDACQSHIASISTDLLTGDLPQLIAQTAQLPQLGCTPETLAAVNRQIASAAARRALQARDPATARALLDLAPVQHWEVTAVRGTLAAQANDHAAAASAFNLALDLLGAADMTEQRPELEPAARRLIQLAQEQMLLAESISASLRSDGTSIGVFKAINDSLHPPADGGYNIVRAVTAESTKIALPVRFKSGSAELDAAGEREAKGLAFYLRALPGEVRLTIAGHTDDQGDAAFNMELSRARAEALRDYLKRRGFSSEIKLLALGETAPPEIFSPDSYTSEQRRALARRVEVYFEPVN
jgi:outer membrane protein OmpA-like peptidoglycan-associated protein